MTKTLGGLSLRTKLGFGVCDLGGNLFFTATAFWLPSFMTDVVGLNAALMGVAILIGKLWDAVTDPAVGYISDRTVSAWGRRRPYIFWGSFPLFLSMWYMWTAPGAGTQTALFWWATIAYCVLCTAYTVVNIPYSALTPELTADYNEQTALNGYRMSFAVVGTIFGAAAAMPIVGIFNSSVMGYSVLGLFFGFLMLASALVTFFSVREPVRKQLENPPSLIHSYKDVFTNLPFVFIVIAWALFILGVTIISGMVKYYFDYVYNAPDQVPYALMALLLTSLVFIPIWVRVSKKIGKKVSYAAGMLIMSAVVLMFFLFGHLNVVYGFVLMALAGVGLATHYVFPYALVPDVIEYDFVKTGVRKEGAYYGTWTFVSKIGAALASASIGLVLAAFGYVANTTQTPSALFGIRLLIGPIPAAVFIVGVIVLMFYPINQKKYEEIRLKVEEMNAGKE